MTSEPTEAKVCVKVFFRPLAAVIVVMTATIPMIMPSVVRAPRLLLAAIAASAILKDSDRSRASFISAPPGVALDQAVAQAHDAVRVGGDVVLVGDQDDGVALGVQVAEHAHDLGAGGAVQVAGRLVGQDDRGLA